MSEEIPTLLETGRLVQILMNDQTLVHAQMQATTEIGIYFWVMNAPATGVHFVPWQHIIEIAAEYAGPMIKKTDDPHPIDKLGEVMQWIKTRTIYTADISNDLQVRRMAAAENDVVRAYEILKGNYDATLKP